MKTSRYSEEQIIGFLKQSEAGMPVKELCRKGGFSDATFYKWRAKFGGMDVSDARRLKELEGENAKLKKLLAEYDLILLDMQMPKLNGVEAARQIRALPGYASTPILAVTANAFSEDRELCLAAGMNDHIAKPVDSTVMYQTLLKWLPPART